MSITDRFVKGEVDSDYYIAPNENTANGFYYNLVDSKTNEVIEQFATHGEARRKKWILEEINENERNNGGHVMGLKNDIKELTSIIDEFEKYTKDNKDKELELQLESLYVKLDKLVEEYEKENTEVVEESIAQDNLISGLKDVIVETMLEYAEQVKDELENAEPVIDMVNDITDSDLNEVVVDDVTDALGDDFELIIVDDEDEDYVEEGFETTVVDLNTIETEDDLLSIISKWKEIREKQGKPTEEDADMESDEDFVEEIVDGKKEIKFNDEAIQEIVALYKAGEISLDEYLERQKQILDSGDFVEEADEGEEDFFADDEETNDVSAFEDDLAEDVIVDEDAEVPAEDEEPAVETTIDKEVLVNNLVDGFVYAAETNNFVPDFLNEEVTADTLKKWATEALSSSSEDLNEAAKAFGLNTNTFKDYLADLIEYSDDVAPLVADKLKDITKTEEAPAEEVPAEEVPEPEAPEEEVPVEEPAADESEEEFF